MALLLDIGATGRNLAYDTTALAPHFEFLNVLMSNLLKSHALKGIKIKMESLVPCRLILV